MKIFSVQVKKMELTKKSEDSEKKNQNGLKTVATGLFISTEKSRILLQVVQAMLKQKHHTVALSSHPRPNNTCEILLQALSPTGADFVKSKVILESYLNMIKESRPNFVLEKQPEVIDVEDEDKEISCIVLDDTIDTSVVDLLDASTANSSLECGGKEQCECKEPKVSSSKEEGNIEVIENTTGDLRKNGDNLDSKFVQVDFCESRLKETATKHDCLDKTDTEKPDNVDSELTKRTTVADLAEDGRVLFQNNICRDNISHEKTIITKDDSKSDCDIIVIDSFVNSGSFTNTTKRSHPAESRFKNMYISPTKSRKLKSYANPQDIEVVEIEDDDVIIVDNSISTSVFKDGSRFGSGVIDLEVTFNECSRAVVPKTFLDFKNETATSSPRNSEIFFNSNDCVSSTRIEENRPSFDCADGKEQEKTSCKRKCDDSSTKPLQKKSKFAYKRLAHLSTPLTKKVSSVSNTTCSDSSNSNIYNPNSNSGEKRTGLRPIIIDGNNVAVSHGKGSFSLKGVQICINFFEKRGHRQIKAFLPHYRKNRDTFETLSKMERQGTVVITPSRKVEGKTIASYDDRYIVQYAAEVGGVIVTLDNYRDLLQENDTWKETIQERLLMFSWVDDLLMFPQDPLGKAGPTLDEFLKFPA